MVPPLSVGGVSIEQVVECVPLRSIGVTLLLYYYEDIRLPIGPWASFQLSGCAALPPVLEELMGSPEFPTLPW